MRSFGKEGKEGKKECEQRGRIKGGERREGGSGTEVGGKVGVREFRKLEDKVEEKEV